jgi:hypothetical protein
VPVYLFISLLSQSVFFFICRCISFLAVFLDSIFSHAPMYLFISLMSESVFCSLCLCITFSPILFSWSVFFPFVNFSLFFLYASFLCQYSFPCTNVQ